VPRQMEVDFAVVIIGHGVDPKAKAEEDKPRERG
jgi:hypothetical protein